MLRSAAEPPPQPVASTSSPAAAAAAAAAAADRGDIPDCVLSELWAERSDGVGSPLIDIFTETDCSSQVSDDESAAGGGCLAPDAVDLAVLPIAVTEKLIEVVEDDDFGAVSEGGGLIWVVENDVEVTDGSEASHSPAGLQQLVELHDHVTKSPQRSPKYSEGGDPSVCSNHLQKSLARNRRKPGVKLKGEREPVVRSRPGKSPRKSPTLRPGSGGADSVPAEAIPVVSNGTLSVADDNVSAQPDRVSAAGDGPPPPAAIPTESGGPAADPAEFVGFPAHCWPTARARWLRQLGGVSAEEREIGDITPADAALLRLRELATTSAAARTPPSTARTAAPRGQGDGDQSVSAAGPQGPVAAAGPDGSAKQTDGGNGDVTSHAPPPTYVSLMPDAEKEDFKGSFLSMFSLRHVNDPAPPSLRPIRTMRHRLRKRKPVVEETEKSEPPPPPPRRAGSGSLLAAARRPLALPSGRRVKVLRKPGSGLLRRGFLEQRAGAGDSSGDEAAAAAAAERRQLRGRRRLLDFSELVEVDGVLDTANTYSGCEEPPRLLAEAAPVAGDEPHSPPPAPPELSPQRWPRADSARCRICRKFIARVLLPLHLRLHRTGYLGCDVCGQVLESAAALYRHRLGHEPPRFTCPRCGRQFDALAKLERHRASAHALICARCGVSVPTPELVHEHNCGDGGSELPPPAAPPPPTPPRPPPVAPHEEQQPEGAARASTPTAAAAPSSAEAMTSSGDKQETNATKDGLVCQACGKSFLVRFNYTMHMKMVHKLSPGRPAGDRGPPSAAASAMCPDVISCLGDILSADLYNEILSVV